MKALLASAAVALVPFAATAATVGPTDVFANSAYSDASTFAPGGDTTIEFQYDVQDALTIEQFSVSGSGTNNGADLASITFGMQSGSSDSFDQIFTLGSAASAIDFINGTSFAAGTSFSILFETTGVVNPTSVTVSFDTVAPIPLPAAGLMLLAGLGGLAIARRKA